MCLHAMVTFCLVVIWILHKFREFYNVQRCDRGCDGNNGHLCIYCLTQNQWLLFSRCRAACLRASTPQLHQGNLSVCLLGSVSQLVATVTPLLAYLDLCVPFDSATYTENKHSPGSHFIYSLQFIHSSFGIFIPTQVHQCFRLLRTHSHTSECVLVVIFVCCKCHKIRITVSRSTRTVTTRRLVRSIGEKRRTTKAFLLQATLHYSLLKAHGYQVQREIMDVGMIKAGLCPFSSSQISFNYRWFSSSPFFQLHFCDPSFFFLSVAAITAPPNTFRLSVPFCRSSQFVMHEIF